MVASTNLPRKRADTHLSLALSHDAAQRLKALARKTEADSYAEVIRNALQLYEAMIEATETGKQFLTRDRDGVVELYPLWSR